MAKEETKKPAQAQGAYNPADYAGWSDEQIGFAPYWQPAPGAFCEGIPTDIDDRDPKFVRINMLATRDIQCFRGPVDSQEPVMVKEGEFFSLSVYEGLKKSFVEFLTCGAPIRCMVKAEEKIETAGGNDFWRFSVKVHPESMKHLVPARMKANQLRAERVHQAVPVAKAAEALGARS